MNLFHKLMGDARMVINIIFIFNEITKTSKMQYFKDDGNGTNNNDVFSKLPASQALC